MTNRLPVSCFIIARNEADRIGFTIKSVKDWVSEIIVVDSGSSDETVRVSESLGARVFSHEWQGYGLQKRFGEEQCKNDWLLNLDADEVVTPELAVEIAALFSHGTPLLTGFFLKVRDLLPGERKLAPFAHTNHCLRLYDKNKARFSDSPVHDTVMVREGETGLLQHPVLHKSFRSLAHMLDKLNNYSTAQAVEMQKKPMAFARTRLVFEVPVVFFKPYILRLYILRGWRGFTYSMVYAYGRFIRIAKYIELRNQAASNSSSSSISGNMPSARR